MEDDKCNFCFVSELPFLNFLQELQIMFRNDSSHNPRSNNDLETSLVKRLKKHGKGERARGFPRFELMSLGSHDNIDLLEKILDFSDALLCNGDLSSREQYEHDRGEEKKMF